MQKLVNYFYEVGSLRKIARAHRQRFLTDDLSDNIAAHSHRVAIIGWFLAKLEGADAYKTATICLFHDTPEARSGDINWVHKKYVKVFEEEIIAEQLEGLTGEDELSKLFDDYEKRESREAKLAKDADVLDQLLLCQEYVLQGNEVARHWIRNQERWLKRLTSESAKKLVPTIFATRPDNWTESISTSTRR